MAEEKILALQGSPTLPEEKLGKRPIFVSYADNEKNDDLVERLIRQFLTELDFNVYTFTNARSNVYLQAEIDRLIDECPTFLAFLTKDVKEEGGERWHPNGNIPGEIARALSCHHNVIVYHEEGVSIPSNTKSYYCRPFENDPKKYAELFIDLIKALKNQDLLRARSLTYTFMETEQLQITNVGFSDSGTKSITMTIDNTGTSAVTITEIWVNNIKQAATSPPLPQTIVANSGLALTATYTWVPGKNYQVKLISSKGNQFYYSAYAPT